MNVLSMELIRAVDRCIDERHDQFADLGRRFFDQSSTQVRNLQQIACSATRFADVEDFVKNQMGKGNSDWKAVGRATLDQLSQLRDCSEEIAEDPADRMEVRLRLARGWARAVVAEYMYRLARKQMEASA